MNITIYHIPVVGKLLCLSWLRAIYSVAVAVHIATIIIDNGIPFNIG